MSQATFSKYKELKTKIGWDSNFGASPSSSHIPPAESTTVEAPSCLMWIKNIEGGTSLEGLDDYKNSMELLYFEIGVSKDTVVGDNNQLLSSGRVICRQLEVILRSDAYAASSLSAAFTGQVLEELKIITVRNIGSESKPQIAFKMTFRNSRVTSHSEGHLPGEMGKCVTLKIGFDGIQVEYIPIGDDAIAKGQVAAGYDLVKNTALK